MGSDYPASETPLDYNKFTHIPKKSVGAERKALSKDDIRYSPVYCLPPPTPIMRNSTEAYMDAIAHPSPDPELGPNLIHTRCKQLQIDVIGIEVPKSSPYPASLFWVVLSSCAVFELFPMILASAGATSTTKPPQVQERYDPLACKVMNADHLSALPWSLYNQQRKWGAFIFRWP